MIKLSKDDVHYRKGTKAEHCSVCTMFHRYPAPGRCDLVHGLIYAEDTCDRFEPKRKAAAA
jgi:hypothetical protein